jgi:hypothetical protein
VTEEEYAGAMARMNVAEDLLDDALQTFCNAISGYSHSYHIYSMLGSAGQAVHTAISLAIEDKENLTDGNC